MEYYHSSKVSNYASQFPFNESEFYKSNMGDRTIENKKEKNCVLLEKWNQSCEPSVPQGYHKPLNETCPQITGVLNKGPEDGCTSIWNNMTKRKSLVKDY